MSEQTKAVLFQSATALTEVWLKQERIQGKTPEGILTGFDKILDHLTKAFHRLQ